MPPSSPSEDDALPGRRPPLRKSLGQHHLRSASLLRPLMGFLAVGSRSDGPQRTVLEIGPGGGVLTAALLDQGFAVLAVELDVAWAIELNRRLVGHDALSVAVCDAMDLPWERVDPEWIVVGNLPYNVATAIIVQALERAPSGLKLGFLVQLEVAERLCAAPGGSGFGALSVLVRARTQESGGEARVLGKLKPGAFHPPPKVDSAFVGLTLSASPVPPEEETSFRNLVFSGYGQRRKTLANALSRVVPKAAAREAIESSGLDSRVRAEELDVPQWLLLGQKLGLLTIQG